MTNVYQVFLDITKDWLYSGQAFIDWFNTPLWYGGFAPIQLLTLGGLLSLSAILVIKLIL